MTGSGSRIEFTLESSLTSVDQVEHKAGELAHDAGVPEDDIFGITMAVREAAVNAVVHGNQKDPSKQITVSFENTGSSLVLPSQIRAKGSTRRPSLTPWPLKTCCAARAVAYFLSDPSWMRYISGSLTQAPNSR